MDRKNSVPEAGAGVLTWYTEGTHTFARYVQCDDPTCKSVELAFSRGTEETDNLR